LLETAEAHGLSLMIENVVCNVESPAAHLLQLYRQYPGIRFVYDTKMAAFHGELDRLYTEESAWLWREGHICHYHVNDYGGGYLDWSNLRTLPIGAGHIAFSPLFDALKATDYRGDFTVEATAFDEYGTIHFDILNESFDAMRRFLA
jgi:sugar phosphate isomerase/epimerase